MAILSLDPPMDHNATRSRDACWTPVSVVLPCYNEQAAVAAGVEAIREVLTTHGVTDESILGDDG